MEVLDNLFEHVTRNNETDETYCVWIQYVQQGRKSLGANEWKSTFSIAENCSFAIFLRLC